MLSIFRSHKNFVFLVVLFVFVAALINELGPSQQLLQSIHADSSKLYEPGKVVFDYFGNPWDATRFDPTESPLSLVVMIVAILYMLMICYIGKSIILTLLDRDYELPRIPLLFSGFLIGYTTILMPIRIVFIIFEARTASILCIFGVLSWSLRSILRMPVESSRSNIWISFFLILVLISFSVLYRFQSGRNFLVSDSNLVFLDYARKFKADQSDLGYLPTWDQQSDEWIFNAPGIFLLQSSQFDSLWYLVSAAFGQLSLFFSIYLFSRYFFLKLFQSTFAIVGAWFPSFLVFFSTPAWTPAAYVSLFGGQNPVIYLGHPGRYVGLILPCVMLFLFEKHVESDPRYFRRILFFSGIGFMSVHLTFYVILIGLILVLIRTKHAETILPDSVPSGRYRRISPNSLYVLIPSLLSLVLVYYLNQRKVESGVVEVVNTPSGSSVFLLLGSVLSVLLFRFAFHNGTSIPDLYQRLVDYLVYGLSIFSGFLISGNTLLSISVFRSAWGSIGSVLPFFKTEPSSRGLAANIEFQAFNFSGNECWVTGHCLSIWGFLGSFGLVVFLTFGAIVSCSFNRKISSIHKKLLGLVVILFPITFFIVDFTGGNGLGASWIKTRFVEPVYYYILVLSWLSIAFTTKYRKLLLIVSTLWFLPLIILRVLPQTVINLVWFVKQIR